MDDKVLTKFVDEIIFSDRNTAEIAGILVRVEALSVKEIQKEHDAENDRTEKKLRKLHKEVKEAVELIIKL